MAIQSRRGEYGNFDPAKMLPGEWACVTNGDPGASDGKSVYMCFEAGKVKRMATYDDMKDSINEAAGDIIGELTEDVNVATETANKAAETANKASQTANTAAQSANAAVQTANSAAQKANEAAERAEQAASGVTGNYYGAYDSFPRPGVSDRLYIDNTVTPSVIYTWDEEKQDYIRTSGKEGFLEESGSGTTITLQDQKSPKSFRSLKVYGKSTQDGTPSPESPTPIVSAGDEGEINISVSDGGTQLQTLTISTPNGLPGILVESGGNYTDESGQQWIADVKDYGTGKYTQNVQKIKIDASKLAKSSSISNDIYYVTRHNDLCLPILGTDNRADGILCNYLKPHKNIYRESVEGMDITNITEHSMNVRFGFGLGNMPTLEEAKQWFSENDVFVYYPLATPIVTDISAEEMEAYKALKTYTPTTVISSDSGVWMEADLVDSDILYPHAENTSYDNSTSGLTSDNVQAAIDENAEAISALNSRIPVEILEQISFPESTSLTKTGISVVIPAKSFYAVTVMILYSNTAPSRVVIESGSTALGMNNGSGTSLSTSCSGYTDEEITLTCSAMFPAASRNSTAKMTGFYISAS